MADLKSKTGNVGVFETIAKWSVGEGKPMESKTGSFSMAHDASVLVPYLTALEAGKEGDVPSINADGKVGVLTRQYAWECLLYGLDLKTKARLRPAAGVESPWISRDGMKINLATGERSDQVIQHMDGDEFVAMNACRDQQVEAEVGAGGRRNEQRALGQPVQLHPMRGELDLLAGLTAGEGQLQQLAEGEHAGPRSVVAVGAVDVLVVIGLDRLHFQLQADQVGRQRAQHQIGVFGIAILDIHADHQLAVADLLNPYLAPLPDDREAGAGGFQLGSVDVFQNQLQAIAH